MLSTILNTILAEELFAAPIHWGFVFLGWSMFFLVPLAMQIFPEMARLIQVSTGTYTDERTQQNTV